MGSISTVTDEEKVYDAIYSIAYDALTQYGLPIYSKDRRKPDVGEPTEYVYVNQVHDAYKKHTLQPNIYDVPVEFLCEINVTHDNIPTGRQASKELQRAFHLKASPHGLVVNDAMATDAETLTGQRFVVSMTLTYTTKMV